MSDEQNQSTEPAPKPAIDHIIDNFDQAVGRLRNIVPKVTNREVSNALQAVLDAATAQRAFMAEVRHLLGDIL